MTKAMSCVEGKNVPDLGSNDLSLRLDGIGHILRDRILTVPPYQRSYAWKLEQVDAFWSDLRSAMMLARPDYFMGTVVLAADAEARLTVIDGQQRLATTAMLIATIRNFLRGAKDESRAAILESDYLATRDLRTNELRPRLLLNNEDAQYFKTRVVEGLNGGSVPSSNSNRRIDDAMNQLRRHVDQEVESAGPNWQSRLFDWIDFLEQHVRVIAISVESESDAFLIFETLNDRGLELTIADLLKNYLLSLNRHRIGPIKGAWEAMVGAFETEAEEQTTTTFIRHYWTSLHGPTRERELYRSLKSHIKTAEQAADVVYELRDEAPSYAALLDAGHDRWRELEVPPALVETVLRFGLEQPRPLLLAAMSALNEKEFVSLLEAIVSWSVRGLIVGGIGGGTTERYYANAARAVRRGKARSLESILEILDPVVPSDEEFRAAFAQRRVNQTKLARYYLAALENYIVGVSRPAIISDSDETLLSLVYVMPKLSAREDWPAFEDGVRTQMVLRLGNQVLAPKGFHATASDWPERRQQLVEMGRLLATNASTYEAWDPDAINELQNYFAADALMIWPRFPSSRA